MAKKSTPNSLWTVMVYLAGDNNLTEESVFSVTEMEDVDPDDRISVIAQFDPRALHIPTHRYVISRAAAHKTSTGRAKLSAIAGSLGSELRAIEAPTIKFNAGRGPKTRALGSRRVGGETDSGDPATLFDFISWTQERFPADRYMVILAGHGAGTEEDFLLQDENPSNSLSIPALRKVFEKVKTKLKIEIDILGMDVCLMSMVEVCYELKGLVKYLVSSESFSPAAGWPYGQIVKTLQDNKAAETEKIASLIVREYINFYSDYVRGGLSVDQSVLKVRASAPLVTAVRNFTRAMTGRLRRQSFRDDIVLAHWESQSYNGEQFVDLRDFCERLEMRLPRGGNACRKVIQKIDDLVRTSCFSGVESQFSNGVSIYFPWADVAPRYQDLSFARRAGWNGFLQEYVFQTRRKPRGFRKGRKNEELLKFAPDRPVTSAPGALSGEPFRKTDFRKTDFRKTDLRKTDLRGGNPIVSMRNPPITLIKEGLSDCIRANPIAVERLEKLSEIRPRKTRG